MSESVKQHTNPVKRYTNSVRNAWKKLKKRSEKKKKATEAVKRAKCSVTRATKAVDASAKNLAEKINDVPEIAKTGKVEIAIAACNHVDAEENSNISKNQKKKFIKRLFNVITKATHKNEVAKANEKRARKRWVDDNLNLAFAILIKNAAIAKSLMFDTAAATAVHTAAVVALSNYMRENNL